MPAVDNMRGLIVGAEFNTQITLSGVRAILMAWVKLIVLNYAIFQNHFSKDVVNSTQIHCN